MRQLKAVCLALYIVLCYFQAQGADKYTDENRPYEFGFTIDGEQHRHEKKDENGIIMGEFGFITADGVYHVTVYATDENGNFKILSMKNIRVKPYPTSPEVGGRKGQSVPVATPEIGGRKGHSLPAAPSEIGGRQGHSLPVAPSQQLSTPYSSLTSTKTYQAKVETNTPVRSCSHCRIPTTTKSPLELPSIAAISSTNKQLQKVENPQTSSKNYNNQQLYSQHENSQPLQKGFLPSSEQNYYPGSVSNQLQQNYPNAQSYPNGNNKVSNQEQYPQTILSQQNYVQTNTQDEFNVGRKYLKNAQGQQSYKFQPSTAQQSDVGLYNQKGFNAEQHQRQEIIADQSNLQRPYPSQNDRQISNSAHSYSEQSGAKIQDTTSKQHYQTENTEQKYNQIFNRNSNNYVQQKNYQTQSNNPNYVNNKSAQGTALGDRQSKSFREILHSVSPDQSQKNIEKPVLVAAQMQLVNKNTNVYQKNPGEKEGLPMGLTKSDMMQLLYTFNYTVGFHGHHEEGYRNGDKIGYYYVTGRNGVKTRVDYVADEKGFHPRISQEVLDLQSDDVPKPETEKEEKYGLKGYEFKWLYYPVDSK